MDFVPLGYILINEAFAQLFDQMGGSDLEMIQTDDEGWHYFDTQNSEIHRAAKERMIEAFETGTLVALTGNAKSHHLLQVDRSYWKRPFAHVTLSCSRFSHLSLPYANRHLADELCFLDSVLWNDWLSNFQPSQSASPSARRKRGRSTGSGYQALDAPLVDEMHRLTQGPERLSIWKAALKLVPRAAGGGTTESKARRLTKQYSAKFRS